MNIQIQTNNLDLTSALSDFVKTKCGMLEKLISDPHSLCLVTLERTTNHHKRTTVYRVVIRLKTSKQNFYCEKTHEDLYACIDITKDDIERSIVESSQKKRSIFRRAAAKFKQFLRK